MIGGVPIRVPRRLSPAAVMIVLACVLVATGVGCSAKRTDTQPPAAEVVEPGGKGAIEPEAASGTDTAAKETCHGVLDCTFFGVGAVLAAPFWVLGAFLGLVF